MYTFIRNIQDVQSKIIGLYKVPYGGLVDLVFEENEYTFHTLRVGNLLGTTVQSRSKAVSSFIKFPDNKNLKEMLDNPFMFDKWYKENIC